MATVPNREALRRYVIDAGIAVGIGGAIGALLYYGSRGISAQQRSIDNPPPPSPAPTLNSGMSLPETNETKTFPPPATATSVPPTATIGLDTETPTVVFTATMTQTPVPSDTPTPIRTRTPVLTDRPTQTDIPNPNIVYVENYYGLGPAVIEVVAEEDISTTLDRNKLKTAYENVVNKRDLPYGSQHFVTIQNLTITRTSIEKVVLNPGEENEFEFYSAKLKLSHAGGSFDIEIRSLVDNGKEVIKVDSDSINNDLAVGRTVEITVQFITGSDTATHDSIKEFIEEKYSDAEEMSRLAYLGPMGKTTIDAVGPYLRSILPAQSTVVSGIYKNSRP